jgi:hypothetical protein
MRIDVYPERVMPKSADPREADSDSNSFGAFLPAQTGYVFSVALSLHPMEEKVEEGAPLSKNPPSPTLPPLVPRGEKESSTGLNR